MTEFGMLNLCLNNMKMTGESYSANVILYTGNVIVSGEMVHPVAYLRSIGNALESHEGESENDKSFRRLGEALGKFIAEKDTASLTGWTKYMNIPESERRWTKDDTNPETEIILKNPKFWTQPEPALFNNTFMAFRIDTINGFVWSVP